MALNIIASNRVEDLQLQLAQQIIERPAPNPLTSELVVVPNYAMGRWLNLRCAQQQGIAANIEYQQAESWIWQLAAKLMLVPAQTDPYSQKALSWMIFALLPGLLAQTGFKTLRRYLADDDSGVKRWQFSRRVAECYDRYQLYRPEMIAQWSEGRTDHWQARLWQAVINANRAPNRVLTLTACIDLLQRDPQVPGLPERISLFAISSLAPAYIALLHALAQNTEIYLYLHSPTDQYWADLVSQKKLARQRLKNPDQDSYFETGNPLLTSWGRQGQVMQDLLLDLGTATGSEQDMHQPAGRDSMLHCLQSGFYDLQPGPQKLVVDDSISIHVCHSPMRECQVLHDQLLNMLQQDEQLRPEDILVMVPEISRYAAYIEAVFQTDSSGKRPTLAWNISDISIADGHPLVKTFLQLLKLPQSRFTQSEIRSYLESSDICNRFAIDDSSLELIYQLLEDSQVRWGIDGAQRHSLGLPDTHENSWQQAWDRLFCGYAMVDIELWQNIAPIGDIGVDGAIAIAQLRQLFDRLVYWRSKLSTPATTIVWRQRLHQIIDEFFAPANSNDENLQPLRDLVSDFGQAETTELSPALVQHWMEKELAQKQLPGQLYSGGITFCGLQPMRNIPFAVICLLGMQEQAFPRSEQRPAFDLMRNQWQPGDPSARDEDRYLMLETLLGARRRLYFSYCGRSLQDDSECQPSTLLRELLDWIDMSFESSDDTSPSQMITRQYPMQAFSIRNFQAPLKGYDRHWFDTAKMISQPKAMVAEGWPQVALTQVDNQASAIELSRLQQFLRHPPGYFFRHRLGIQLSRVETPGDDEDFSLDGLQKWALVERMATRFVSGAENDISLYRAEGLLPHGGAASTEWSEIEQHSQALMTRLETYRQQTPERYEIDFAITPTLSLRGDIGAYYPGLGVMHFSASKQLKSRALVSLWLEHLAICLCGQLAANECSRLISLGTKSVQFNPIDADSAATLLQDYVEIFHTGQTMPLPIFPNTSYSWAAAEDPEKAMIAAVKQWQRDNYAGAFPGENEDPYIRLALHNQSNEPLQDPLFQHYAERVYSPVLQHMTTPR